MINKQKLLWVRAESKKDEYRAALVPQDVKKLISAGWNVVIEDSTQRCFKNEQYSQVGCQIVSAGSWLTHTKLNQKTAFVLALKELPNNIQKFSQQHIYFAHAFKGQLGSKELLKKFSKGGGTILDLEYLNNEQGKRLTTFSYWAGYIGAKLAIINWLAQQTNSTHKFTKLAPTKMENLEQESLKLASIAKPKIPKILLIGAKGNSGRGAITALKPLGAELTLWDQEETKNIDRSLILKHDILINCVLLTKKTEPFLSLSDLENTINLSMVCDVACDFESPNNQLPIYKNKTTWQNPVATIKTSNKSIKIIAIDNLPSLLPMEASVDFSQKLVACLLQPDSAIWKRCEQVFKSALKANSLV